MDSALWKLKALLELRRVGLRPFFVFPQVTETGSALSICTHIERRLTQ
jgi:hypothetical protein